MTVAWIKQWQPLERLMRQTVMQATVRLGVFPGVSDRAGMVMSDEAHPSPAFGGMTHAIATPLWEFQS
jgi:hypothetical protein